MLKNKGINIALLLRILNRCTESVVPLNKRKGERRECTNYREVNILGIPGKIYGRVLINRVVQSIKEHVAEE